MIKVGIKNGEVVIRLTEERDHVLLRALAETDWRPISVYGEDRSEEVVNLHTALSEIEWE